jgi:hypothetical protein
MTTSTAGRAAGEPRTAFVLAGGAALGAMQALEEQRSEKYRHALIAVVGIGVRASQLGGTDAWLSSHLESHA